MNGKVFVFSIMFGVFSFLALYWAAPSVLTLAIASALLALASWKDK